MFNIVVCKDHEELNEKAFQIMKEVVTANTQPVLGLATGSSPVGMYKKMIEDHQKNGTSYRNCITFNLDEYVGLPKTHEQSYYTFMHTNLFNDIDVPEENIHIPDGNAADEEQACRDYEDALKKHTVDIQVLGIGSDGHIAFNEPGTPFTSETHLMDLTEQTRKDNARFFEQNIDLVPTKAITQGLASIMRAKKIILIATGANKADAVYNMIKGSKSEDCPASILQGHSDVTVFLDQDAASKL
jgi:glucosamine-6-phosphate deaminase